MIDISKEFLIENYVRKDLSLSDIERKFGFKRTTIHNRLIKYNIPRRGFGGHKNQIDGIRKVLTGKPSWNKGKGKGYYLNEKGYKLVLAPDNPMSKKDGFIMEHRLIMSKYIDRPLNKNELVHHKNGIKDDNRIENLEIVVRTNHYGDVKCPYCRKKFVIK